MEKSPSTLRVIRALEHAGVQFEVREFPEGTRTSREAADALGCGVGQIAKSIVFSSGSGPVLAIASGSNRIDLTKLEQEVGEAVEMMKPNQVKELTGFAIGGVPPVAHFSPMEVFIDRDLLEHDKVWAAAGTPWSVFSITPADLVKVSGGSVADIRE